MYYIISHKKIGIEYNLTHFTLPFIVYMIKKQNVLIPKLLILAPIYEILILIIAFEHEEYDERIWHLS